MTIIFNDDFTSGNFSNWTSTTVYPAGSGSVTVASINPHSAPFHGRFTINALAGYVYASCSKTIAAANVLNARAYVLFNSGLPLSAMDDLTSLIVMSSATGPLAYASIVRMYDGTVKWRVIGRSGTTWVTATATTGPVAGTSYCVELHWANSATAGVVQLYVDGVVVAQITAIDTSAYGNCTNVNFGIAEKNGVAYALDVFDDDCVIADTYIGTVAPPTNPVLTVNSSPEINAPVYIDGSATPAGNTPLSLSLTAGNHTVRVDAVVTK